MTKYEELLAGVERLENMGGLQEALELLRKMIGIFPEQKNELEFRVLQIMFQQERYEEALDEAIEFIPNDDGWIYQWLMEHYYEPFSQESEELRKQNMECLSQYEYYYGAEDSHQVKTLFYNGYDKLVYCKDHNIVVYKGIPEVELKRNEIVLISDVINVASLAEQISSTKYNGTMPFYEVPVYLYYDKDVFGALLQCIDVPELLKDYRTILLIGEEQIEQFFGKEQIQFPDRVVSVWGRKLSELSDIINDCMEKKAEKLNSDKKEVEEYYLEASQELNKRIRNRKPRILFLTSYFTTVLKNHTRDMKKAAEKRGLETELLLEQGSLFSVHQYDFYKMINGFRPDIIFCIDHFRFEKPEIPSNIMWICWVQDPLEYIMDPQTPDKLGDRDFVLNHYTTWKEFANIGYPKNCMMDAPVPSNQEIYRPYVLTDKEKEQYGCDICFVCHASDVDAHIEEIAGGVPAEYQDMIVSVYKGYQSYVYETGYPFFDRELFGQFIDGAMIQNYGVELTEEKLTYLTEDMYLWFNQRVYRETLVDWILDAGFTNIKLWGNGWKTNPKYAPYAMGPAENGETLSKIYQASKIVIGNNIMTTAAARAWETMLSGGFYLSNYIPEEDDVTDIRKIVTVGDEVEMFYDKDDLIEKIRFYLTHEEERQIMIEKGRKAALEKMTFDKLLEKMLSEVAARI